MSAKKPKRDVRVDGTVHQLVGFGRQRRTEHDPRDDTIEWYLVEFPYVSSPVEGLPNLVPMLRGVPGETEKDVRLVPREELEKAMHMPPGMLAPGGWPRRKREDGRPRHDSILTPSREYAERCEKGGCRIVRTFHGPPAPRTEEQFARADASLNEAELAMSALFQRRYKTAQRVQKSRVSMRNRLPATGH